MDRCLRALGALAEDLGLLASTHMVAHNDGTAHIYMHIKLKNCLFKRLNLSEVCMHRKHSLCEG